MAPAGREVPFRRTKIVATLGPRSATREAIAGLLESGADVFRLNFSHGTADEHAERARTIRELEREHPFPVGIVQDLQGPKLRIGRFAGTGGVTLETGAPFSLTRDPAPGDARRVSLPHDELLRAALPGHRIRLRDGLVELVVRKVTRDSIDAEVTDGGELTDLAGVNVPDTPLSLPALTPKDESDVVAGARMGFDWVALSFVRKPDDLREARARLRAAGSEAALMAKIERPEAVRRFDEILAEADGIMVARGDLGVEMAPEEVPMIQKRIIRACIEAGKPVVTATQMLQSMIDSPRPTRAEASDVANAICDGSDAIMLSGETAVGRFPVESVRMMDRIASEVERSPDASSFRRLAREDAASVPDAVCRSAAELSQILGAAVIAAFTASGATAGRIARHRPTSRIVALTPSRAVARRLALHWGVHPLCAPDPEHFDALVEAARERLSAAGLARRGDRVVLVSGVPFGVAGSTNALRVETIA